MAGAGRQDCKEKLFKANRKANFAPLREVFIHRLLKKEERS
jgi:hypothetical protein